MNKEANGRVSCKECAHYQACESRLKDGTTLSGGKTVSIGPCRNEESDHFGHFLEPTHPACKGLLLKIKKKCKRA